MPIKKIVLILLTFLLLQGCVPLVIGGAAATATYFIIHDKRKSAIKKSDEKLQATVEQKLNQDPRFKNECHTAVSTFRGTVLLAGQCPSKELQQQAERTASTAPGIVKLYNEISIEAPNSTLTRASDEWITTKIRLHLRTQDSLKDAEFQIVTENGVVFLMGNVTNTQANTIVSIVRKVYGVQKVVKMFTYTAEVLAS